MTYNTARLIFAVPGAAIGAGIVMLFDMGWSFPMLSLGAAIGAFAAFVIAGIVQEGLRRESDDADNRR